MTSKTASRFTAMTEWRFTFGNRRTFYGAALVALAALAAPARAAEFFDYGFTQVDNSAGGSVLDGYVSQQLWADTELLLLGAQLRIELESGSLFQDTFLGSEFSFGGPHELLAAEQPSLAFDTHVGINGAAPNIVAGGAVNLGGEKGVRFDGSGIDVAWGPGPGNLQSGGFDLGMLTLSGDAIGRGAILLSGADAHAQGHDRRREMFAHVFEIEAGAIRFSSETISSLDVRFVDLDSNFKLKPPPKREPPAPPREDLPPAETPPPLPEIPTELPDTDSPPPLVIEFHPGPIIEPDPVAPADDPYELVEPTGQPQGLPAILIYYPGIELAPGVLDANVADPTLSPYSDVLQFSPDAHLLLDRIAAGDGLDGITHDATDMAVLRAVDGTHAAAIAANYGELAVPLASLTEEAVSDLISTGNWSIRGANLVFGAGGGVPEPSSIVLALLAAAGILVSRWNRYWR